MNNENLLKPGDRTPSERRESASQAGKASGEARRRKRDMKARMKMILALPTTDVDDWNNASAMGVKMEEIDNETVMLIGLYQEAKRGNVAAVREIRNILGKDIASEELALKKKEMKRKTGSLPEAAPQINIHITAADGTEADDEY